MRVEPERFKIFVRYMIQAAKEKRCVPYAELEHVFGLNHGNVGNYAGRLGDYCKDKKGKGWPPLNALIINTTTCVPSDGFDAYGKRYKQPWGALVCWCWSYFHTTSAPRKQVQDFSGSDIEVDKWWTKSGYDDVTK